MLCPALVAQSKCSCLESTWNKQAWVGRQHPELWLAVPFGRKLDNGCLRKTWGQSLSLCKSSSKPPLRTQRVGKTGPCYISLHRPTVVVFSKVSAQYLSSCILFCTMTLPFCQEEVESVSSTSLKPGGPGTALTNRLSRSAAAYFQHSP